MCAVIVGGLHGRPSGNVGGVVYGAARSRIGKLVTARELVSPSNPKTTDQVLQRNKFAQSLYACRRLGSDYWQDPFNRAIGQLPGFQSLMSILLNNTDDSFDLAAPADTPLGDLHFPDTPTVVTGSGAAGTVEVEWTDELGTNGTTADPVTVCAILVSPVTGNERNAINVNAAATRTTGSYTFQTYFTGLDLIVGVFFEGAGAADGKISICEWFAVTAHA